MATELGAGYITLGIKRDDAIKQVQAEITGLGDVARDAAGKVSSHLDDGFKRAGRGARTHGTAAGAEFMAGLTREVQSGVQNLTGQLGTLGRVGSGAFSGMTGSISGVSVGIASIGLATIAVGKQLYDVGARWDSISDDMLIKTGLVGTAFDNLQDSVLRVGSTTAASFEDIANVAAGVTQSIHITGNSFDVLTKQIADYKTMTGDNLNMVQLGQVFRGFDVQAGEMSRTLDQLFGVFQRTGIPVSQLVSQLQGAGSAARVAGLDLGQTAGLIETLNRAGVDASKGLSGFRIALGNLAKSGQGGDPTQALANLISEIDRLLDSGKEMQAIDLAKSNFGRGFDVVFDAIRSGNLDAQALVNTLQNTEASISDTRDATADWSESWQEIKNTISVVVKPAADNLFEGINTGLKITLSQLGLLNDDLKEAANTPIDPDSALGRMLIPGGGGQGGPGQPGLPYPTTRPGELTTGIPMRNTFYSDWYPKAEGGSGSSSKPDRPEAPVLPFDSGLPEGFQGLPLDPGLLSAESSYLNARHDHAMKQAELENLQRDSQATQNELQEAANAVVESDRKRYEAELRMYEARADIYEKDVKQMDKYRNQVDEFSGGTFLDFFVWLALKPMREQIMANNAIVDAREKAAEETSGASNYASYPVAPPAASVTPGAPPTASTTTTTPKPPEPGVDYTPDTRRPAGPGGGKPQGPSLPSSGGSANIPATTDLPWFPSIPGYQGSTPGTGGSGGRGSGSGPGGSGRSSGPFAIPGMPSTGTPVAPGGGAGPGGQNWSGFAPKSYQTGGGGQLAFTPYGLDPNSNSGGYGQGGVQFPDWVRNLEAAFGVKASTYGGHQTTNRNEAGYAPNPTGANRGIDWSGPVENMQAFAKWLEGNAPRIPGLEQIIWQNPQTGERVGLGGSGNLNDNYYGTGTYSDHANHVHTRQSMGLLPSFVGGPGAGGGASWMQGNVGAAGGQGAVPDAMTKNSTDPKAAVYQQMLAAGIPASEWGAVDSIVSRESSWNPAARNKSSGAFGLFQFLGHENDKYGAMGGYSPDPNSQAAAGIQYMIDRYGSPSAAKSFWDANGWYEQGGEVVPINAHKGEHVFTTKDVAAMGGQSNVYNFRRGLHYQNGGEVMDPNMLLDLLYAQNGGAGGQHGTGAGIPIGPGGATQPQGQDPAMTGPEGDMPTVGRTQGYIPAGAGASGQAGSSMVSGALMMGAEMINSVIDTAGQLAASAAAAGVAGGTMGAGAAAAPAAAQATQMGISMLTGAAKQGVSYGFQMGGILADAAVEIMSPFGVPRFFQTDPRGFMPRLGSVKLPVGTGEKATEGGEPGGPVQPGQLPGMQPVGGPAKPAQGGGVPSAAVSPIASLAGAGGEAAMKAPPMPTGGQHGGSGAAPGPAPGPAPENPGVAGVPGPGGQPSPPPGQAKTLLQQLGIFDNGGWLEPNSIAANMSKDPEPLLSGQQWANVEAIARQPAPAYDPQSAGVTQYFSDTWQVTLKDTDEMMRRADDRKRINMMRHSGRMGT